MMLLIIFIISLREFNDTNDRRLHSSMLMPMVLLLHGLLLCFGLIGLFSGVEPFVSLFAAAAVDDESKSYKHSSPDDGD